MDTLHYLKSLLIDLQGQLHMLGCWDSDSPSSEALASTTPFAVDALEFYQWLQWIFIPKMHDLIERELLITMACGIAPMAEQWAAMRGLEAKELISVLVKIDQQLSGEQ